MATTPAKAQYAANQMSLPRLTMPIINLQAKQPTPKADMKPQRSGSESIEERLISPPTTSKSISPRIGASTIRNENCATADFLLPSRIPVAMVVPERESPGIDATACDRPMMKASR